MSENVKIAWQEVEVSRKELEELQILMNRYINRINDQMVYIRNHLKKEMEQGIKNDRAERLSETGDPKTEDGLHS